MKCEIHNAEMKWEGSLQKGSMKCAICSFEASDKNTPYDYNRDPEASAKQCAQSAIVPSAPPSIPNVSPSPQYAQISWAKARLTVVDKCIQDVYSKDTPFVCPYCAATIVKSTVADHYTSGTPCYKAYSADYDLTRP